MKIKIKLAVCCLSLFAFVACGEKITVVGADGKEYESYQECCAAEDFEAAHLYLAKMENAARRSDGMEKALAVAKEEVFKQEALFLMSQDDEIAKKRILYLLKEEEENDNHISMLIDLAIENDDDEFVKTLANLYGNEADDRKLIKVYGYLFSKDKNNKTFLNNLIKKHRTNNQVSMLIDLAIENDDDEFVKTLAKLYRDGVGDQELEKVYDYLYSKDKKNEVFLNDLIKKHGTPKMILRTLIEQGRTQQIQEYASELSLDNEELLAMFAKKKNSVLTEMILGLLTPEEEYIEDRPSLGVTSYYWATDKNKFIQKCESYESSVSEYNQKCVRIMNIGIQCKNINLAQRAIAKMKSNITHREINPFNDYYRIKVATGDKSEIAEARKALDDAVRSGSFR